jgi:hypothetical protein
VNDGVANAKAAAKSASETVNENVETLKDKACKLHLIYSKNSEDSQNICFI